MSPLQNATPCFALRVEMPATSSPTLLPPDLTLDVLWRHAAVAPLDDEALTRIARMAAELCGGAYVRISLKQRDTLAPVARAGPSPMAPVAPPHRLRAVHEVLDGSQAWNCLQASAGTFLDTNADDAIAPAEPWTHTVVPLCAPASEAPQGVIEALRPAQQDTQVARPVHECLGDCASLVATELAHRYETLRHAQTEDHLKQVAENVGSGLYRSTPEEGIIYANRAFIDLFGYDTLDEIVALPASDLYADPHDQTRLLQAEHENDGLNEFLVEMQRRDGSTFMARISSTVKRDDNGRILYYDGVVADVTERQTIERALRRQEELFRILAENAQPAVFLLDEDGTFLLAEGHDLPAIGLDPDEAVGSSVFDHYADFPAVLRGLKRAVAGHEVRDTLHISTFVFDVWYSPLRNEAHEVVGCVGMAADVTEHRAAEEARLRSAERWERLVEAHPDPIVVSIGGCIQYINPAGAQVLGADHADQLLGEDLFAFIVDDEKRQAAMQRLQRVYEGTSSTLPMEQTIQWEDRPPRTVEVRSVPITYNGQPAAQTIVRDITRRREAERTLRAERDLLERIFNTSAAAIVVMDANGVIAEANERAEDVLRMPKAALKAGSCSAPPWRIEGPSGEALSEDEKPFSRVKAAKRSMHDLQYALRWPDGTRKVVSVNGAPLLNENNVFSGAVFPGLIWQRCQAHFRRNVIDQTPATLRERMHEMLDQVLRACSPERAREAVGAACDELQGEADQALKILETGFEDATAVLRLPAKYRRRLRTTNMVERFIEEIRRRETVIRIFPNLTSAQRLIGALCAEQHEEWSTGRRYLIMDEFFEWKRRLDREPVSPDASTTSKQQPAAVAA